MKEHNNRLICFLNNFFLSHITLEEIETEGRILLIKIMILIGQTFLLTSGIIAFIQKENVLAVIDIGMLLSLGVLLINLFKRKKYFFNAISGTTLLFIFYIYLFFSGGKDQTAYVWVYTFPLIAVFLLGSRLGSLYCLFFFLGMLFLEIFGSYFPAYTDYPTNLTLRILPSYLTVYVFSFVLERARSNAQNRYNNIINDLFIAQKKLKNMARTDALTDLNNRIYFDQHLEHIIFQTDRYSGSMALIMIDIDHFKKYNDTYGHPEGDMALRVFAKILKSRLRRKADMAFRYGGEEFTILLSKTNKRTAIDFAKGVIEDLKNEAIPHSSSPKKILTASFGIAFYPSPLIKTHKELLIYADKALYKAKNSGRNTYKLFEPVL